MPCRRPEKRGIGAKRRNRVKVSVVSVSWNGRETLPSFLDSIPGASSGLEVETVVVDNGSTDGSLEYLASRPDVTLVDNGVNLGFGAGINRGLEVAQGDFVVLSNPDLVFREHAIARMLGALREDDQLAGVCPVIETPGDERSTYPISRAHPGLHYGWCFFSGFQSRFAGHPWIDRDVIPNPEAFHKDLPWLHGCCGMFRRQPLADVGGFDPRFFLYFEDCDLGRRLVDGGWRLRVATEARVLHLEGKSSEQASQVTRTYFLESWHMYLRKYHGFSFRTVGFFVVLGALSLQGGVQLVRKLLGRRTHLGSTTTYLLAHLSTIFRDLDRERQVEMLDATQRLRPVPEPAAQELVSHP